MSDRITYEAAPMVGIKHASEKAWMVRTLGRPFGFEHIVCWSYQGRPEDNERNARAIAHKLSVHDDLLTAMEQAEAALAVTASYRAPDQARQQAALESARAAIAKAKGEAS